VVDCASALLHILLKGESGQAYNVADPNAIITIRELAEMVAQIGQRKVVCQLASDDERKGYNPVTRSVYSIDKLSDLGWTIEGSMYEKMQRTIAAM
jgi:nucleoside-diphosphate-sugar epimerase